MQEDYVHGNIDKIVANKEKVELNEVFFPATTRQDAVTGQLTILMDGPPGVGKTTIARKLCFDWANGDLLQEYQLVVFVSLREVTGDCLESLMPQDEEACTYLQKPDISGNHTLFIFDGYDELSSENRNRDSFFMKFIQGKVFVNCSVLVTSRPYASGVLRGLPQITRHVEVLGFTKEQISNYVIKSLSEPKRAQKLTQALEERLDILSLCYIPLNCKIVLFVFEQLEYELPATLTELYKIFLLNTIKRSLARTHNIMMTLQTQKANELCSLPDPIQKDLRSLCKLAFEYLQKDQLVITSEDVKNEKVLLLGLLNSRQSLSPVSVTDHYQFLHLTIQEFLAARYIAFKSEDFKVSFVRENYNDIRFRLTLLFLAGLTKLQFLSSGASLVGEEILNLSLQEKPFIKEEYSDEEESSSSLEASATGSEIFLNYVLDNMSCSDSDSDSDFEYVFKNTYLQEQQDKFFFLAHFIFESQKPITDAFHANIFDISRWSRLSDFHIHLVAHFLSYTPKDHVWDLIDLTKCELLPFSVLYSKRHAQNKAQVAIGRTKCLYIDSLDRSLLMHIIKDNTCLAELTITLLTDDCFQNHDNLIQLCCALLSCVSLKRFHIDSWIPEHEVVISRRKIAIKCPNELCLTSLNLLLKFADIKKIQCIAIADNPNLFKECKCKDDISRAIENFCEKLSQSEKIQVVRLTHCGLSDAIVEKIVLALYEKDYLKELNVDGNKLKSLKLLLTLLENGLSIKVNDVCIASDKKLATVTVTSSEQTVFIEPFMKNLLIPSSFHVLKCEMPHLEMHLASTILGRNQHLSKLETDSHRIYYKTCELSVQLATAITTHKTLQYFHGFGIRISKSLFSVYYISCANFLRVLLDFLDTKTVHKVDIDLCSDTFQDCKQCDILRESLETKLCTKISNMQAIKQLEFHCSRSNATAGDSLDKIIESIEQCKGEELECIKFSCKSPDPKYLSKLLQYLCSHNKVELQIQYFRFKIMEDHLKIESTYEYLEILESLLLPLDIKYLTLNAEYSGVSAKSLTLILFNNPHLIDIDLSHMSNYQCEDLVYLSSVMLQQKIFQKLSFKHKHIWDSNNNVQVTISRSCLCWNNKFLCPKAFENFISFLSPGAVETIQISTPTEKFSWISLGYSCHCDVSSKVFAECFLDTLPQFTNLKIVDISHYCVLSGIADKMVSMLMSMPKVEKVLISDSDDTPLQLSTETLINVATAISLYSLKLVQLSRSRIEILDEFKLLVHVHAQDHQYLCPILENLNPKEVHTLELSGNFEHHCSCSESEEVIQQKFENSLVKLVNLEVLDLPLLPQKMVQRVLHCLFDKYKLETLRIANIPSLYCLGNILALTSHSLIELQICNLTATVCHQTTMSLLYKEDRKNDDVAITTMLKALAQNTNSQIKHLQIHSSTELTEAHIEGFKILLCQNECTIESLTLCEKVLNAFIQDFADTIINNTCLREIHLIDISLSGTTVMLLLKKIADNKTLETLDLSFSIPECSDFEACTIGRAIKKVFEVNHTLSSLNLSGCCRHRLIIQSVEKSLLSNTTITDLDLSSHTFCKTDDCEQFGQSVEAIITKNQFIQCLNLSFCHFTDTAISSMADSLRHDSTLQALYLDNISIFNSDENLQISEFSETRSWAQIFSALKQNSSLKLHYFSLCGNSLGQEEFLVLKELLHYNKTITTLKVVDCGLSSSQLAELEKELPNEDSLVFERS